jgi:ribonucleoside-diphosphate reductase alpha chain
MVKGLPYDSEEGRAIAAAVTAIMTGRAYRTSAAIAGTKGTFPGFPSNRKPMMRVMGKHRDAAYAIDPGHCPPDLLAAAHEEWDECVKAGEEHGYRNAQATVLAPTGTIGLLMDCDTTGVEPDFALVKFKKLAGGGYFKIVNESVPRALRTLGYDEKQIAEIIAYARGAQSLAGVPHVNRDSLRDRGLLAPEIDRVERALPGALNLAGAFNRNVLGDECLKRLGFAPDKAPAGDHLLAALGFTSAEVATANDAACGTMTLEGAPHLAEEHLPVFDCANRCGRRGTRFIRPMGHIRMMAAVQPFLSGAISKTVNLPNEAGVDDVEQIYVEGWKLGLKAIALYRDGCKQSQPLSVSGEESKKEKETETAVAGPEPVAAGPAPEAPVIPGTAPRAEDCPVKRHRLATKRRGFTQEARVGGQKVYLRTGEYDNGQLGEIFVDMAKEGAAYRSLMNCFAIAVSLGLQYGVPLDEYVDVFTFTRFEPHGPVSGHPNIKFATSVMDYLFRVLGYEYMGRTDFLQVQPENRRSSSDAIADTLEMSEPDLDREPADTPPPVPALDEGPEEPEPDSPQEGPSREEASAAALAAVSAAEESRGGDPAKANGGSATRTNGGADLRSVAAALVAVEETPAGGPIVPPAGLDAGKAGTSALGAQMQGLMGDAPFCDVCGHITVRNGACYKCLNCGNSIGCS